MNKRHLLLLILIGTSLLATAQTTGDYRSNAAAFNWDVDASWQRWNGAAWVAPTAAEGYPGETAASIAGTVTIQAGHNVTANVDVTTNDIGNLIVIGTITENNNNFDIDMTGNFNITGTVNINGNNSTIEVGGSLNISGAGLLFLDDNDITVDVAGDLTLAGTGRLDMSDNPQDINVLGNLSMDGTSQILGNNTNCVIQIGDPLVIPGTSTFTVPVTATNARIGGVTLTVMGATTVPGTLLFNSNTGVKTFRGNVTVSGSWTSTAITSNDRLVFGGEVMTSGVFACGCN